jgi:hypothetical protein
VQTAGFGDGASRNLLVDNAKSGRLRPGRERRAKHAGKRVMMFLVDPEASTSTFAQGYEVTNGDAKIHIVQVW